MKKHLVTLLLLAATSISWAQDPIFSQFYAMPLQINPAFAGSAQAPRIGIAYRNQWTGFNSAYRTYGVFYEQYFDRARSGLGFSAEGDDAGNGIYKTNRFLVNYAYRLPLTKNIGIKLGVEAGLHQTALDWNRLIFPDQIDPLDGIVIDTKELRPEVTNTARLDISSGMLLVSKKWHLGFALKHMNTPSEGILLTKENVSRGLPIRYVLHAGTEIIVKEGNKRKQGSFIAPNILFASQGPYQQLNIGAYASIESFFGGVWYRHTFRNSDAAILNAGFRKGFFRLGLSYDMTTSRLADYSGGTYELTMGLIFKEKTRKNQLDCTRMFQ